MSKEQRFLNPNDTDPFFQTTQEIYFGKLDNPRRYLVEALKEGKYNIGFISHKNSKMVNLIDHYSIRADEAAKNVFQEVTDSDDFKKLNKRGTKSHLTTKVKSLVNSYKRDILIDCLTTIGL